MTPRNGGRDRRHTVWPGIVVLIAGIVLVGCGTSSPASSPASSTSPGGSAGSSEQPKTGGTLTWAYLLKPASLDPNVWSGDTDSGVMRLIFDPLIWSPKPGEYIPGLATSWTVSPDGLTYTFKLRTDVKFHDGTPFNAAAVKFTFDRIVDPKTKSLQTGAVGPFKDAEVIDDSTVAIHLTQPWGAFLANLSSYPLSPVSPTAVGKSGDQFGQAPVGTGPFMFDKWVGNDLYLKRNPDYNWAPTMMSHTGPAYLDEIIVKEVPEASTRMAAIQTGEAQMTHFPVLSDVDALKTQGITVDEFATPGFSWSMPLNVTKPPTDDLNVRQAIIDGIDRAQIVKTILFGHAQPSYGPLTRSTFAYDPAVESTYPYDPVKAGQLLDQSGWVLPAGGTVREKNGQKLHLDIVQFDSDVNKPVFELIQGMLAKLGFDVTLDVTNYDAFAARITADTYNAASMNWVALDPDQVIPTMLSCGQVTGGGQFNRTRICDPALDKMIADAGASSDNATRVSLYGKIQTETMDKAWIEPIFDNVWITLTTKAVKGLTYDIEGRPLLYNVSVN